MAGSSLWLVPPPSHPLHEILTTLITTTLPALVPPGPAPPSDKTASPPSPSPPTFAPHLTLTSNIDPSSTYATSPSPQAWLDALPFPAGTAVRVIFERVKTDNFFFRRCYLKVGYDGVRYVAAVARARGVEGEEEVGRRTEKWLEEWRAAFGPHVSLLYGDVPLDEAKMREVEKAVRDAGIALEEGEGEGEGLITGWEGGTVWLVPTDEPLEAWKPIATRTL